MVELANPLGLFLLPIPFLLLYWRQRRRRGAIRFSSLSLFQSLPSSHWPRRLGEALRFLAIVLLIAAICGPRTPDRKTRIPGDGIAILFLLDTSGSMEETTFTWQEGIAPISRREAAKRVFRLFIAGGDGPDGTHFPGRSNEERTDAIGLIAFSTWPQTLCPPTLNQAALLDIVDKIPPANPRDTATNIGDALAEGILRADQAGPKRKVLILLSDGEHNFDLLDPDRRPLKPRQAATLAANLGIPIYTIDTGGEADPLDAESARQRLEGQRVNQTIAQMTGGESFTANDGTQLAAALRRIDELETQPILSPVYRRYHDYSPWLALAAFSLAVTTFVLEQTVWRRVP
jgi:Ca-activated chloride channel family protein